MYLLLSAFVYLGFLSVKEQFSLPNIPSWCVDMLGKGLFACWSISSSELVLQHECSLKNMHLFSLWLQWIVFSSSHNGNMGCAKQSKRKKMFIEDWKCAKECKFLLTGEQAVYHELGIFFSWLITRDCSNKYLLRRCSKIIVPLEFMWKLMLASPIPDLFPLVFLHIFLVMLWSE